MTANSAECDQAIRRLSEYLQERRWTIAVAESLTGGLLAATIARGPDAAAWFRGAVVAYHPDVKHRLLDVPEGPVVSERCARAMAAGARVLLEADVGLAVTGVGGPGPEEGQPAGTVWFAISTPEGGATHQGCFYDRSPEEVCSLSCSLGIDLALRILAGAQEGRVASP